MDLVIALVVGLQGAFLMLLFAIGLLEKRPVRSYGDPEDEAVELGPYLPAITAEAAQNGLVDRSLHRNKRFPLVASFWFSPQVPPTHFCARASPWLDRFWAA